MTRRPLTVYDQQWELICMLCTELPSIEAGTAVPEDLPPEVEGAGDGRGIAMTYTIQPEATWGDGTPVTTKDVLFTWKAGRHPTAGAGNLELNKRIHAIDVIDDKTFVRSEEHTSELQSLMRISYAVFCLKKKKQQTIKQHKRI